MISFILYKKPHYLTKASIYKSITKGDSKVLSRESTVAPALAWPSSKCAYLLATKSKIVNMTQILLSFFYYLNDYDFYLASRIGY